MDSLDDSYLLTFTTPAPVIDFVARMLRRVNRVLPRTPWQPSPLVSALTPPVWWTRYVLSQLCRNRSLPRRWSRTLYPCQFVSVTQASSPLRGLDPRPPCRCQPRRFQVRHMDTSSFFLAWWQARMRPPPLVVTVWYLVHTRRWSARARSAIQTLVTGTRSSFWPKAGRNLRLAWHLPTLFLGASRIQALLCRQPDALCALIVRYALHHAILRVDWPWSYRVSDESRYWARVLLRQHRERLPGTSIRQREHEDFAEETDEWPPERSLRNGLQWRRVAQNAVSRAFDEDPHWAWVLIHCRRREGDCSWCHRETVLPRFISRHRARSRLTSSQTVTAACSDIPAKFHWPADSETHSPFKKCDDWHPQSVVRHVVLSGGTTIFPGIGEHINHRRRWFHLRRDQACRAQCPSTKVLRRHVILR